jgi:glyoxylase-like metal-dependent hydrolase (beta-lactamase superfamily II)
MQNLSRRAFARSMFVAPAAVATLPGLISAPARAATPAATPAGAVPTARFAIGRFTVTALTDGNLVTPFETFTGLPEGDVAAGAGPLYAAVDGGLRLSFNSFLVDGDGLRLLVDTGPAGLAGETGRLPAALDAVGGGAVDAVVLTHLHFDHISGLVENPDLFAGAEVYADRRDVAYFTDPARRTAAPDFLRSSFDQAAKLAEHSRLQQTDGAHRIAPGIEIVDLTGHTPGHIGVRISDAGQSLLMVSDGLFSPAVHPRTLAGFAFEQDPPAARAMRERLFADAAAEGTLLAATHMPFPGLGRIGRDGDRLVWAPADWANGI